MLMHGFLTKSGMGWVLPDKMACYATNRRGLRLFTSLKILALQRPHVGGKKCDEHVNKKRAYKGLKCFSHCTQTRPSIWQVLHFFMPETEPSFYSIDKDQEVSQKYQVVKN